MQTIADNEPSNMYRLELLPAVPAYLRKARIGKSLALGQLVYYGPSPFYYGIGEITRIIGKYIAVDFRGTGSFGVHEDVIEKEYLVPVPQSTMGLL